MRDFPVVEENGMIFDLENNNSSIDIFSGQGGALFAFVQCVDDRSGHVHRYWGAFSWDYRKASIAAIMRVGGKWPNLRGEI